MCFFQIPTDGLNITISCGSIDMTDGGPRHAAQNRLLRETRITEPQGDLPVVGARLRVSEDYRGGFGVFRHR
jgi:hypothetical protein